MQAAHDAGSPLRATRGAGSERVVMAEGLKGRRWIHPEVTSIALAAAAPQARSVSGGWPLLQDRGLSAAPLTPSIDSDHDHSPFHRSDPPHGFSPRSRGECPAP